VRLVTHFGTEGWVEVTGETDVHQRLDVLVGRISWLVLALVHAF